MDDLLPIVSAAAGVLAAGLPIIWRLASRLQKMESVMQGQTDEIKCKLDAIDCDLVGVVAAQKETVESEREARKELWKEFADMRERMVKLETKINGGS